jgi:phosphoglycerate dehydrogenase-like enzyme
MTNVAGAATGKPLVLVAPDPQRREIVFADETWAELQAAFDVVEVDATAARLDELLPGAFAIVGQPDLPAARITAAVNLRAVCNVEGNFFPNVDYAACTARGVYVLGCGPAYAQPVAEFALGLALDLARGISAGDRAFRACAERYTEAGNAGAILLQHADVGLLGVGNLGRTLLPLLRPFGVRVRGFDPWLPPRALAALDVEPVSLDDLLRASRFVFVLASATSENAQLLDAEKLSLIPDGGRLVLVSRAAVVDFAALYREIEAGRLHAAVDVWPEEPVAADDPARTLDGMVLSAHRAGALNAAFHAIGEMVLDDLTQIASGLPPVRMQQAARELATRYRNKPVIRRRH